MTRIPRTTRRQGVSEVTSVNWPHGHDGADVEKDGLKIAHGQYLLQNESLRTERN